MRSELLVFMAIVSTAACGGHAEPREGPTGPESTSTDTDVTVQVDSGLEVDATGGSPQSTSTDTGVATQVDSGVEIDATGGSPQSTSTDTGVATQVDSGVDRTPSPNPDVLSLSPAAVVLFGGIDNINGVILSDTWEWNGQTWTNLTPAVGPVARTDATMASLGDKVVLFGGNDGVGLLGDTWEWDGNAWTEINVSGPSARSGALMAAYKGRVVLFGGDTETGSSSETWEFDGSTWTLLLEGGTDNTPNPARWGMASTTVGPCDAGNCPSELLVLFGPGSSQNDTWTFDGNAWTQVDIGASTSSAYPPPGEGVVASVGSAVLALQTAAADGVSTGWLWSAGQWTPAYGNGTSVQISYGGFGQSSQEPCVTMASFTGGAVLFVCNTQETWTWTAPGWSQNFPAESPASFYGLAMATRYAP